MTQKSRTKDEFFLVKLHELAVRSGDLFKEIDRYEIGKEIGQNDKGVDTIVNLLAQANFIKKTEGATLHLTEQGYRLAEALVKEFTFSP